jgi:hypothetical protein
MKYWGKKPHNIWATYIERYCPEGGLVGDPFAGSAVAAFEAVKLGRKAIAFDLNPLTAFFIEVAASEWKPKAFVTEAERIRDAAMGTEVYREHFLREMATVLNYRWADDEVEQVAIEGPEDIRSLVIAERSDRKLAASMSGLKIGSWYPTAKFPDHPSITHRFIKAAGGDTIDNLWTRRTLSLLATIFEEIRALRYKDVRLQLLSAFVQTLHLCSKMVIPRHEAANRDFSGSWGRPDYIIRRRQMEQNPVDVFWRSCGSRQGVAGMMNDIVEAFPDGIDIHDVRSTKRIRRSADINYGAVDIADMGDFIRPQSLHFVITDPPYAGLIRYLPLSMVWLAWLVKVDAKYKPDLKAEITVNKTRGSRDEYRRRLRNAFEQINRALMNEGKLVVTFHHQDIREFNDFVQAVRAAGFYIEKVTHQYNRRSGESNVANPYGVSASDFYVRCVKRSDIDFAGKTESQLGTFIIQKAIEIIGLRNEPTPYGFLFQGLWPELLQAGYTHPKDSSDEILKFLKANEGAGKIFQRTENHDTDAGDLWWFNEPSQHISHPDRPLRDRVADSVLAHLRRRVSVKLDDVIGELFREYPNGLTPDPRTVRSVLERYAHRAGGKWKIDPAMVIAASRHSDTIASILKIGERMDVSRFVGRREQPERTSTGSTLRQLATLTALTGLRKKLERGSVDRLEMVDVVFLKPDSPEIICLWEVENSTNFGSAIYRGSNAPHDVPKFMVVPDDREAELLAFVDPLFVDSFNRHGWRYLTYSDVTKMAGYSKPSLAELLKTSKALSGGTQNGV